MEAITAKREELQRITEEKKAAAGDAMQLVAVKKREQRAKAELAALEEAHKAATYTPEPPTDKAELMAGLEKYRAEWQGRVDKINADIAEADAEADRIEKEMQEATAAADTKTMVEFANRLEEIKAAKVHMMEMQNRAKAMPIYPAGAAAEEWQEICQRLMPEWKNRIAEMRVFAAAYTAAADAFLEMERLIQDVRRELQSIEGGYYDSVFTKGESSKGMTIDEKYARVIANVVDGNPLLPGRVI